MPAQNNINAEKAIGLVKKGWNTFQTAKKLVGKVKKGAKTAKLVARGAVRTARKNKLAAAATLLGGPLAYGASHGFRRPSVLGKVLKPFGVAAAKTVSAPIVLANAHKESWKKDIQALAKKGKNKKKS